MYKIQIGRLEGERKAGVIRPFIPVFEIENLTEQEMLNKITELVGQRLPKGMIDTLVNPCKETTFLLGFNAGYRTVKMK